MGKRGEPFEHYPEWTHSRFWSFIRSTLRRAWSKYPVKFKVLNAARRAKPPSKKGRHKWEYQCASCSKWVQAKECSVDHKVPAGSLKDYDDLPEFVRKLFVGEDDLQVLCDHCHKIKTKEERNAG